MARDRTLTEQFNPESLGSNIATRPVLVVVYGPNPEIFGNRLVLHGGEVAIGRNTAFHGSSLGDPRISGHHADVVVQKGGRLRVLDQGSKNGTFVGEERVTEVVLPPGGFVQFGRTTLRYLNEPPFDWRSGDSPLLGVSVAMASLREAITTVAKHHRPVLIEGPSGTGKEPTAREIHRQSGRSGRFVAVNCAALPRELLESELFGHAQGAFTGAKGAKVGLFSAANQGTLFLDEFTEMPLELQAKLLRVIQDGRIRPVGALDEREVDTRILAATNRDALVCVKNETLRLDLYGRLRGGLVRTPALAERPEDIGVLARFLLARADLGDRELSPALLWALLRHPWPFNVRGLEHILLAAAGEFGGNPLNLTADVSRMLEQEREFVLSLAEAGGQGAVVSEVRQESAGKRGVSETAPPDKDTLNDLLKEHHGVVSKVASVLEVHRYQVYRWIKALGIDVESYR